MSRSHAAASSRSASPPRTGARPRARAATPWECAQRRGRVSCRSARASGSAHEASVFMWPRLGSHGGTFTDGACRLKTSCSASRPIIRHCWPELGRLRWHQGSCGIRRYRREPDGNHRRVLACRPGQRRVLRRSGRLLRRRVLGRHGRLHRCRVLRRRGQLPRSSRLVAPAGVRLDGHAAGMRGAPLERRLIPRRRPRP
jgi:hypothetical protein